jgi:hypothetical protein
VPTLTSLSPSSVVAGSSDFTLSATGTSFVSGGKVFFGTTALATTVASATSATAAVPASLVGAPGSVMVTFVNPAPGGGTSGALAFQVVTPADSGSDANPSDGGAGCSKLFGDPARQVISSLAFDSQGNTVVTGWFEWTTDFGGGPIYSPGDQGVLVAKFDASCNHLWSVKLANGSAFATTDPSGNVFVAVNEELSFETFDLMLVKLDPSGGTVFTKRFAGNSQWTGIASDRKGGVVAVGAGYTVNQADAGTTFVPDGGSTGDFVVAFDADGNFKWQAPGGGASAVLVDSAGNVILDGTGTVHKLDAASHATLWSRYLPPDSIKCDGNSAMTGQGGPGGGAALTATDDIVLACTLSGSVDIGTGTLTSAGERDVVLVKLSGADGTPVWAKRYGGPYDETLTEIAVDGSGNLVVTGSGGSAVSAGPVTVDVGAGPMTTALGDPEPGAAVPQTFDLLLARYDANGNPLSSALHGDGALQTGAKIGVAPSGAVVLAGGAKGDIDFGQGLLANVFHTSEQAFLARSPGVAAPIPGQPSCDAGGTCPEFIIPVPSNLWEQALTMNSTTIFWSIDGTTIQSCPKTGCSAPTTVISGLTPNALMGITANDQYLFWAFAGAGVATGQPPHAASENSCSLSDCAGTAVVRYSEFPSAYQFNTLYPPVLDATDTYFADASGKNILRCPIATCGSPTTAVTSSSKIMGFAPTPSGVVWIDQNQVVGPGFSYPAPSSGPAFATDGTRVFWTANDRYEPRNQELESFFVACPLSGCGASPVVLGWGPTVSAQIDGGSVYWLEQEPQIGPTSFYQCPVTGCPPRTPKTVPIGNYPMVDDAYVYSWIAKYGSPYGIYRTPK